MDSSKAGMSSCILEVAGIYKSFFGVSVLRDVSFSLEEAHILGLIGENGAGKSTLMNILGGVVRADAGRIRLAGADHAPRNPGEAARLGVAFIHQELNLFTNLSITENVFIGGFPRMFGLPLINRRTIRTRARQMLKAVDLDVSPDTPVERLSPGERQLVEVAKALHADAKLIIFDEPTTSLTARETERLFNLIERLRASGKSIIYISHILGDVQRICDDIVVLRDGEVVGTGPKDDFSIGRMISLMVGRSIEQLYPPRTSSPSDEKVLQIKGVSQTGILENVDLALYKGEVLGIFGLMGSGRTELARIIFGLDSFERGEIKVKGATVSTGGAGDGPRGSIRRQMAFVTEDRRAEGLLMDLSIADNIGLVSLSNFVNSWLQMVNQRQLHEAATSIGHMLQIKSSNIERQPAKSLSGGNQQKVVIGKWLLAKPQIFIMDEPTRGIDVGAKYEVYNIINDLAAEGAGVLVISSEIEELMGVCDRIVVMSNGEIQANFERGQFNQEAILRAAFREAAVA